jgi:hypothetical protein
MSDDATREMAHISDEINANCGDARAMQALLQRQQLVHERIQANAQGRSAVGNSVKDASNLKSIAEVAGNQARSMSSGLEKITPQQFIKYALDTYPSEDGSKVDFKRMALEWAGLLKSTPPMPTMHAALLAAVPEKKVRETKPKEAKEPTKVAPVPLCAVVAPARVRIEPCCSV